MSVVAAYDSPFGLVMASDCAVTYKDGLQIAGEPKVWTVGEMMYGCVGGSDAFSRIRYETPLPGMLTDDSPIRYVVNHVLPRIQVSVEDLDDPDWEVIVGHPMGLVVIDGNHSLEKPYDPFMAIGSGERYALTALDMMMDMTKLDPGLMLNMEDAEAFVENAVLRAIKYDSGCGHPIVTLSREEVLQ